MLQRGRLRKFSSLCLGWLFQLFGVLESNSIKITALYHYVYNRHGKYVWLSDVREIAFSLQQN